MDIQTIDTYNKSAKHFSNYFAGIGSRVGDIEKALELSKTKNSSRVIEIGCGDGRDAVEIVKRVKWYEGVDPSEGLLKLAKKKLPGTNFVLADALSYSYPTNIDIVFAFASLLHVHKTDLSKVFKKVYISLNQDGIFYISLKMRDKYEEVEKQDEYGKRMFYFYNPEIIKQIANKHFSTAYLDYQTIGKTDWFTIALKKE